MLTRSRLSECIDLPTELSTLAVANSRLWSRIFRFFSLSSTMNCCSMAVSVSFLALMKSSSCAVSFAMVSCSLCAFVLRPASSCRVCECAFAETCAHSNGLNSYSSSFGSTISPSVTWFT